MGFKHKIWHIHFKCEQNCEMFINFYTICETYALRGIFEV